MIMNDWYVFLFAMCFYVVLSQEVCCEGGEQISEWQRSWKVLPTSSASWSLERRIPMTSGCGAGNSGCGLGCVVRDLAKYEERARNGEERGKYKVKRKFKKFLLPLLLAYKLKFFTLIPVLIGGLVLLTGATGLAGFFFALFAAVMGLKSGQ